MRNVVIWLIAGGVIGALASLATGATVRRGPLLDILTGSVGAFLVGLFLTPFFGVNTLTHGAMNVPVMLISSLGAILLIALFHWFRHASV
jgi:uncharacterized membrane protein YeaQ/YmgE (transglycosylase-associated protein family)